MGLLGGDWLADRIAAVELGWRTEQIPAEWEAPCRASCKPGHRVNGWCPAAGNYRNEEMVPWVAGQPGPKLCLPFIDPCTNRRCAGKLPHGSHGATGCAALAVRYRIQVRQPA